MKVQVKVEVCIKCKRCGLPRKGHFDRKPRSEKLFMVRQKPAKYPIATSQLAAVSIQKIARSFLIQLRHRRNLPIEKWQQKCVHYLYSPYGRLSKVDIYRRIRVYHFAVLEIQSTWRKYLWLRHLKSLGSALQDRNVILLQRVWRLHACRRFYIVVRKLAMHPEACQLKSLIDFTDRLGPSNGIEFRLDASVFPLSLYYREKSQGQTNISVWRIVDRKNLQHYVSVQEELLRKQRRRNSTKIRSMTRRSMKEEDVNERRRELIRKKSQRKFKWFYDRKEAEVRNEHLQTETDTSDNVVSDSISNGDKEGSTDDDAEVMAWLQDLDLDGDCKMGCKACLE